MLALDWWEAQGLLLTKSEQTTKAALGPSKQWAGSWEWPAQGTICPSDEVGDRWHRNRAGASGYLQWIAAC